MALTFRRRRLLIALAVVLGLAAVALGGWGYLRLRSAVERVGTSAAKDAPMPGPQPKRILGEAAQQCALYDGATTGEYASFPAVVRAADGRVFAVWRVADGHQFGTGKLLIADLAPEGHSCAWSPPREVYVNNEAGFTVTVGGITQAADGVLVLALVRYRTLSDNQARDFRTFVTRSTDGGHHWDVPREMSAGFSGQSYASSMSTMEDGSLLMALYGTDSPTVYKGWYARFARSTDGGVTWKLHGPSVRNPQVEFTEPQVLVSEGKVLVTLRHDSNDQGTFLAESTDGGQSFSEPRRISSGNSGMPTLARLADGRFAFAYRANGGAFRYATSSELVTWTMDNDATAGSQRRMLHAGFAARADGRTVVVYALENAEGDPNSWAGVYVSTIG